MARRCEFTYRQLHHEVNAFAAILQSLDVGKRDRVVIYLPNIAEAVFAMLACTSARSIQWWSAALPRTTWRCVSTMRSGSC